MMNLRQELEVEQNDLLKLLDLLNQAISDGEDTEIVEYLLSKVDDQRIKVDGIISKMYRIGEIGVTNG